MPDLPFLKQTVHARAELEQSERPLSTIILCTFTVYCMIAVFTDLCEQ